MPDWPQEIRAALAGLNLDPAREAQVVEELSQHLSDRYEEMLLAGSSPEFAQQTLRGELTDGSLVSGLRATLPKAPPPLSTGKDGNERWSASLGRDLRHAARLLRLNSGFATVAIVSLALGIGANTTIFQILDAVRLRTLPVARPAQLARVRVVKSVGGRAGNFYSNYSDLTGAIWTGIREHQQGFSSIAVWAPFRFNLGHGGQARYADALLVSGNYFSVLGQQPSLGRLLSPSDDFRACGADAAVISYGFWQREFGGRPDAVGSKLTLSGNSFEVVGITRPSFFGLEVGKTFDVAVPLCTDPLFSTHGALFDKPTTWWLSAVGRLKPGWTLEQASTQLAAISPGIFASTLPSTYDAVDRKSYLNFVLGAVPESTGVSDLRRHYEDPLWLLLALSGLVLLIACANLANLMLARAGVRQREMALRLSLGATRSRLIRQLLAESLLLALLGTTAGALLAQFLSRLLISFLATQGNPVFVDLAPDWRVLGFTAGVAILTCILFGLAAALQASRTDPGVAMKAAVRGASAGRERLLLRSALVISQVALSLVLLSTAFLFTRTLRNLLLLNAGFRQDHLLVVNVDYSSVRLPASRQMAFKQELLTQIRAVPGVSSAAETLIIPLDRSGWDDNIDFPGGPQRQDITMNRVSPGYFATMETPLLAGRDFGPTDTPLSPRVAIVSQTLARKYYSNVDPLGKLFADDDTTYQIVGVVGDTKYYGLRDQPLPIVYASFTQANGPEQTSALLVRSSEDPGALTSSIQRAAAGLNPGMVLDFSVFSTQVRDGLLRERLMATLSGFFGALAVILATVGLYGVISYMVVRRRSEIGIRMALGASRGAILAMVLREAVLLVGVGVAVGSALAFFAGNAAAAMLYGLKPHDPLTLLASIIGLVAVAMLASFVPARRAAIADPMAALREE
jgi:putative ABC transport system permease protein